MKIALAGAGAFGEKHLDGLKLIDGVEVVSLVGRRLEPTRAIADRYGIGHACTDLADALEQDVDAVILCTPTQMHAAQAIQCLEAGKHVQVEIPLADGLADADPPARDGGRPLGSLIHLRRPAEDESGDTRSLGGKLQPLGRRRRILADLPDDAGEPGVAQAVLHRQQDVCVAAGLDVDHPVGVQAGEVQRRREQVAPPEAPQHRSFDPGEDAGEEDRRAGVVGQLCPARYLVQRAGCDPSARQVRIDGVDTERYRAVPRARALDPRDARTQIFEDDGLMHGIERLAKGLIRSLFVPSATIMSTVTFTAYRLSSDDKLLEE